MNDYEITIDLLKCLNRNFFIRFMKASFSFPSYFGENLDAIDECMRDLSWMQEDTIRIKFKNYHKALEKNEGATHYLINMFRSYEDFWRRRNSNHNKIKFILNKKLQ